ASFSQRGSRDRRRVPTGNAARPRYDGEARRTSAAEDRSVSCRCRRGGILLDWIAGPPRTQVGANRAGSPRKPFANYSKMAGAHAVIGMAKYYLGRAAETEGHIFEAFRLSPRDIFAHRWMHFLGMAKIQLGADAEAAGWFRRSLEANRNSPFTHFALGAALG